MRGTVLAEANEVLARWLPDTRKYERSPAEDRAEKNLKSAIAANIIEGPPNDRTLAYLRF